MAYPIIGMSPGNSYFKDAEVRYLLQETVKRYGQAAILIADIPAIATYVAYGYPENRAKKKAIPKGKNLKNRSKRIAKELGISDKVRIIDWTKEVESNKQYQAYYQSIVTLYQTNVTFAQALNDTTQSVLEGSDRDIPDLAAATKIAVHYLLSELAFLEFAPSLLETDQVVYVYHRNWAVYERYVAGAFDGKVKPHLEFLLLENPKETYRPLSGERRMARITQEGVLRCSFNNYPPSFIEDETSGNFSGIFYDLITAFSNEQSWHITWSEETGYGVIEEGLKEGRFDIFTAATWPIPERLESVSLALSKPVYTTEVGVWVREVDKEIASSPETLTNPFFRVAIKENDISDSIANADFPHWRKVRVPQLTDPEELLLFVARGDADATFQNQFLVEQLNDKSSVKLFNIAKEPIRVFGNCFVLSSENTKLRELLDSFITQKLADGTVKKLLEKYSPNYSKQGIQISATSTPTRT